MSFTLKKTILVWWSRWGCDGWGM